MLPPWAILAGSLVLLFAAWQFDRMTTRRRSQLLRKIAADAKVHYSRVDRFGIAPRMKANFPIAEAEHLSVHDLMYCRGNGCYAYVFTADYQLAQASSRKQIVVSVNEPTDHSATSFEQVTLADASLPLTDQYRALLNMRP